MGFKIQLRLSRFVFAFCMLSGLSTCTDIEPILVDQVEFKIFCPYGCIASFGINGNFQQKVIPPIDSTQIENSYYTGFRYGNYPVTIGDQIDISLTRSFPCPNNDPYWSGFTPCDSSNKPTETVRRAFVYGSAKRGPDPACSAVQLYQLQEGAVYQEILTTTWQVKELPPVGSCANGHGLI